MVGELGHAAGAELLVSQQLPQLPERCPFEADNGIESMEQDVLQAWPPSVGVKLADGGHGFGDDPLSLVVPVGTEDIQAGCAGPPNLGV